MIRNRKKIGILITYLPTVLRSFILICVFLWQCSSSKEGKERIKQISIPTKLGMMSVLTNNCELKTKLLVWIHGSPGSGSDFTMHLEDEDYGKHYCMLVPDRLGFGKSNSENFQPSLKIQSDAIVEMVQFFLKQKNVSFQNATIIGHSYGGPVAFQSTIQLSKSKQSSWKVVLISAPMDPKYEELKFYNFFAKNFIIEWMLPRSWVRSNLEMFQLKKELETLGSVLNENQFPVITIHGDDDGIVPLEHIYFLEKIQYKGNHKYYRIKDGSHFIPWTRYSEIKNIIFSEEF